ncbi:MAG: flagellar biosynthetic protein FliO [Pseudomonadota bacterium]
MIFLFDIIAQAAPVSDIGSDTDMGAAVLRVLIATLFVALFGFGTAFWLRRRNGAPVSGTTARFVQRLSATKSTENPARARIVQTQRLGTGQTLVVVEWQGKELLLGCTPQSMSLLSEREGGERDALTLGVSQTPGSS